MFERKRIYLNSTEQEKKEQDSNTLIKMKHLIFLESFVRFCPCSTADMANGHVMLTVHMMYTSVTILKQRIALFCVSVCVCEKDIPW